MYGKRVDAEIMTDHAKLNIILYGDFSEKEVEDILNSMEIATAMGENK